MSELDGAVRELAERFRAALDPPARAGVEVERATLRACLEEPLPERGRPVEGLLAELEERLSGSLPGTTGGRYFGYVTGGVLPGAALAQAWATALDQNPGLWALSPGAAELEELVLRWLADLLRVPFGSGIFTTGATMANIVGLAAARHWFGRRHGVDVAEEGVRGLPELAVYGSEELHLSDLKALRVLGFGSGCVRRLSLDRDYRMRPDDLAAAIERDRRAGVEPAIVIAQAGSVGTGASDPLEAIAEICARERLWLHVDGAWGAFLRAAEETAPLVEGLERADSLAVDGHKWLNLPNGIGFALLRDAVLHREVFAGSAAYLTRASGGGEDSHELGIEASRNWRGVAAWAALKELGREGVADLVTRCRRLTQELVGLVEAAPRLELMAPAPTIVVNLRYRPEGWGDGSELDELNRRIQERVAAEGDVLVTGATFPRGFCQRVSIVSWRTRSEDVRAIVAAVERAGGAVAG